MQHLPPATEEQPVRAEQTSLAGTLPPELIGIVFQWGMPAAVEWYKWGTGVRDCSMWTVRFGSVCSSWRDVAHGNGNYEALGSAQIQELCELIEAVPAIGVGARKLFVGIGGFAGDCAARLFRRVPNLRTLRFRDSGEFDDNPGEVLAHIHMMKAMAGLVKLEEAHISAPEMPSNGFLALLMSWPELKVLRIRRLFNGIGTPHVDAVTFPVLLPSDTTPPPLLRSLEIVQEGREDMDTVDDFTWLRFLASSTRPQLRHLVWVVYSHVIPSGAAIERITTSLTLLAPSLHRLEYFTDNELVVDAVTDNVIPLLRNCKILSYGPDGNSAVLAQSSLLPKLRNLLIYTPNEDDLPALLQFIESRASKKQLDCVHLKGTEYSDGEEELDRVEIIAETCHREEVAFSCGEDCDH